MPVFDIIIPSFNNKAELLACLEGFRNQTLKDFRLFVCIDGSTDGSPEAVRENNYPFRYYILQHSDRRNHGRNATRNLALPFVKSEYLLFFDSDIKPEPDLLEKHLEVLRQENCVSVGNVDYLNQEENYWASYISSRGYNKFQPLARMPAEYINMGNVAMPASFFIHLKGMDANLVKYGGDDSELAIRLIKHFNPAVINNSLARGSCISGKTLEFALAQLEQFGKVNLKYINQKHAGFGYIFAYDLMTGNNVKSKIFRAVMHPLLARATRKILPFLPVSIRNKGIHYLSAYHLYRGIISR